MDFVIKNLERKRKNLIRKLIIAVGGASLVFVFGFVMLISSSSRVIEPLVLLVLFYIVILFSMKFKVVNSFVALYNEALFSQISFDIKDIKYKRNAKSIKFIFKDLLKSNLGIFHTNDEFIGIYQGVKFGFCDASMELGALNFKGKLFVAEFNKNFLTKILISNLGLLKSEGLSKIDIDNSYINENFTVFAEDITEAMYILSPNLLEKFELLTKDESDKKMRADILFYKGRIYLAMDTKNDALEPNLFKSIKSLDASLFIKEIEKFTNFIEFLKLNSKIYK
ncbi:MAG: DUF3137 domain-containing protein [Campylobacter sp.]|nr:DUF3137 domain-containing protein [Campylobacter sp.]